MRSEIIATYALCGFANFSSLGITLGALCPMAPSRRSDLAEVVLRALLGGIIACLITASVAGNMFVFYGLHSGVFKIGSLLITNLISLQEFLL